VARARADPVAVEASVAEVVEVAVVASVAVPVDPLRVIAADRPGEAGLRNGALEGVAATSKS
jgi:hypothetical protein